MIIVKLPKFDVDHVEILVTKEVSIFIYIRLVLDIVQTLNYARLLELSIRHFIVIFTIRHKENSINHAYRVPILKFWSILQELQSRMNFQDLREQFFKIVNGYIFFVFIGGKQPKSSFLRLFVL